MMTHSIDWQIVLIDDEEDIRQVVSIALEDEGYHVAEAKDGITGLELCDQVSPQIVITDIRMPGMSGLDVLKELKIKDPDVEVIVVTALGDMEQAALALQLDASDYIPKPLDDEILLLAVRRAQRRYIARKQLQRTTLPGPQPEQSRDALPLHENLIESLLEGALVCDGSGIIIALNKRMEQMLGYSREEVLNKMPFAGVFPEKEEKRFRKELDGERYGGKNRLALFESYIIDQSGNQIPVQISATILKSDDEEKGLACFFRDLRRKKLLCDQWLQLVDHLNLGAFTIDIDRRITSFNFSAQMLTGLKESEVIGKDCREVFSDVPCHAKCPVSVGKHEDTDNFAVEIVDQSDVRHLVTRLSAPIYGPSDNVTGCLTILQDHAAFAELINRVNYEERSLKMILDNLDIGIFTVNRGGHITFFNRAAEIISGYNRRQVLGRPCSVIFGKGEATDAGLLRESVMLGESRTNKSFITTLEGEIVPIRADYIPLHNDQGKIVGGLATIQDITLAQELDQLVSNRYTFHSMIGKEPSMQKIFETVEVIAQSDATVLIEGATGTGKDLLAKVIHSSGGRADKPFVKVNCAALPENLLESEMFGYVKGAFTGAVGDKPGRFQEADKGTIFLDEIGDIPLPLQAKLLRVLEDKEFYPLGGQRIVKVDVRIISATNRGLQKLVKEGLFREDLFYRLNILRLELPLLKERKADLPLLIRSFTRKLCKVRADRSCEISRDALRILLNYDYPGNVRELQNIIEHALIVCGGGMIKPEHLPSSMKNRMNECADAATPQPTEGRKPVSAEHDEIVQILKKNNWNRKDTAKELGIDRTTLWRKMKSLGISSTAPHQ